MKTKEEAKEGLVVILITELSSFPGKIMTLEDFYQIAQKQVDWLENNEIISSLPVYPS